MRLGRGVVALLAFGWAACGDDGGYAGAGGGAGSGGSAGAGGSPPGAPIVVDTEFALARLEDPDVQFIDARGFDAYEEARIPGAIHLSPRDLAATVDGVDSQVAPLAQAQSVFRAAGLRNDTVALVYGVSPEYDPARITWVLSYYRHGEVHYLDGGFQAWLEAGGAIDSGPSVIATSDYTIIGIDPRLRVTGDWVLMELGEPPYEAPTIQLVDARSPGEYGAGHIPTALSAQWSDNLEGGRFRSRPELEALYPATEPMQTTVTYCLSGWRASFAWLTLTWLGYEDVRVYDGSWLEWGGGTFPIE